MKRKADPVALFVLALITVALFGALIVAAFFAFGSNPAGGQPMAAPLVQTEGLKRDKRFDSEQDNGLIIIRCEGYSNRPRYDFSAARAQGPASVGFRVVSDCTTIKSMKESA
jgi:hypothetical protein